MSFTRLILRSATYHWRTNLAVCLGVAAAVAVLGGALLVGDSVRGSLRDLVRQRLGRADRAVLSSGFFTETFATALERDLNAGGATRDVTPLIVMQGLVTDQASGRRAWGVAVYGVDDRFWEFHRVGARGPQGRDAFVSRALAFDIGASNGSDVVVRVERPSAIAVRARPIASFS